MSSNVHERYDDQLYEEVREWLQYDGYDLSYNGIFAVWSELLMPFYWFFATWFVSSI